MDILINEPDGFPQECLALLAAGNSVYLATSPYPARTIDAVFIRLRDRIAADFHQRHPRLKFVISPTTGLNHIDLKYFKECGIKVISLKGHTEFLASVHATAEHTLALTLCLIRKLPDALTSVRSGRWIRDPFKGSELFGKTVFIIGYGRLGRQVEHLFKAFGSRLLITDTIPSKVPSAHYVSLDTGLAAADIISIHVDLNDQSAGFLDVATLGKIKEGALLINTSRGELLDQDALLRLLDSGHLAGAALDVLTGEPGPPLDAIRAAMIRLNGKLIVSPHIGGLTSESLKIVELYVTKLFLRIYPRMNSLHEI